MRDNQKFSNDKKYEEYIIKITYGEKGIKFENILRNHINIKYFTKTPAKINENDVKLV